jgi:D-alanyl-D-alanine carboxypeptidase (penicillin-binding protein 5/6)
MPIPTINSDLAYVRNINTDEVYYTKGAGASNIGSIAKEATAIIIDRDYANWATTTTVVAGDIVGGSTAGLLANDVVSINDLMYGMMLPSGNDAAYALARKWGNDFGASMGVDPIGDFVDEMNALAVTLGMSTTSFGTPSGQGTNTATSADLWLMLEHYGSKARLVTVSGTLDYDMTITGGRSTTINVENIHELIVNGVANGTVIYGKSGTATGFHLTTAWQSPRGQVVGIVTQDADSVAQRYSDHRAIIAQLEVDYFDTLMLPKSDWGIQYGLHRIDIGFTRAALPVRESLLESLERIGLDTNAQFVYDAASLDSYNGADQVWNDLTGNGYGLFLGIDATTESIDPVFSGSPGGLSSNEYFTFDSTQYLTNDAANDTFINSLHKNNALFSWLMWFYSTDDNFAFTGTASNLTTTVGVRIFQNTTNQLQVDMKTGSGTGFNVTSTATFGVSAWQFAGFSINEATPAFVRSIHNTIETGATGYSSPSASDATYTMVVGARGGPGGFMPSGSRIACMAMFDTALTSQNFQAIYAATKSRFGL